MTPYGDQDSEIMSCLGDGRDATPANNIQSRREKFRTRNPISLQSVTSGVSSRASSPAHMELSALKQDNNQPADTPLVSEHEGAPKAEENKTLVLLPDIAPVEGMTALPLGKNQMI